MTKQWNAFYHVRHSTMRSALHEIGSSRATSWHTIALSEFLGLAAIGGAI